MKSCPKCGGTAGIVGAYYVRYTAGYDWNLNGISAEDTPDTKPPRIVECQDCRAKFRVSTLTALLEKEAH